MRGKMRKKRWVLPSCGFDQVVDLKLTKNIKRKQKKKMGVGQRLRLS